MPKDRRALMARPERKDQRDRQAQTVQPVRKDPRALRARQAERARFSLIKRIHPTQRWTMTGTTFGLRLARLRSRQREWLIFLPTSAVSINIAQRLWWN